MVLTSSDERLALRFAPYIEEFQSLCAGHRMPFGAPQDFVRCAERLVCPGTFRSEMSSLLRAVIDREHENVTQADLLGLVALSVGGRDLDLTAPELRTPVRQLLTLIGGALQSLWSSPPEQPFQRQTAMEAQEVGESRVLTKPVTLFPAGNANPAVAPRLIEEVEARPDRPGYESGAPLHTELETPSRKPNVFSRIRALWREPDLPMAAAQDSSYPEYEAVGLFKAKYRPFWAVGLCSLSLGLAAGLMLRERPPVPRPVVRTDPQAFHPWFPPIPKPHPEDALPAEVSAAPSLPLAKPSPYGAPLHGATEAPSSAARDAEERAPTEVAAQGDQALEQRFFGETRKPALRDQSVPTAPPIQPVPRPQRQPVPYWTGLTGQSHPPAAAQGPPVWARQRAMPSPTESDGRRAYLHTPREAFAPAPTRVLAERPLQPRGSVFLSASGVMAANLLAAPAPVYPELASDSGVEGRVVVQAVVGMDGSVIATRVLSGPEFLRPAALGAVRRWRYRPYLVDGRATVVATDAILNFQLSR